MAVIKVSERLGKAIAQTANLDDTEFTQLGTIRASLRASIDNTIKRAALSKEIASIRASSVSEKTKETLIGDLQSQLDALNTGETITEVMGVKLLDGVFYYDTTPTVSTVKLDWENVLSSNGLTEGEETVKGISYCMVSRITFKGSDTFVLSLHYRDTVKEVYSLPEFSPIPNVLVEGERLEYFGASTMRKGRPEVDKKHVFVNFGSLPQNIKAVYLPKVETASTNNSETDQGETVSDITK